MKDHERAAFTNKLRDTAIEYHGTQQLRSRISGIVEKFLPKDKDLEAERDALQAELEAYKYASLYNLSKSNHYLKECLEILRENNWRGDLQEQIIEQLEGEG